MPKLPQLPPLLKSKLYKTGQTRGADDDVIYQNRVGRNSTVLIPYSNFDVVVNALNNNETFENGYIVMINPQEFFDVDNFKDELKKRHLELGINSLLFYETRKQWNNYNPEKIFSPPNSRLSPLGGQYVARVPSLTSEDAQKIIRGYTDSKLKGAGIRVYEYASSQTIYESRIQLEYLFWHCENSNIVARINGMSDEAIKNRIDYNQKLATDLNLNDHIQLQHARILDADGISICPLCLKQLSANGFFNKVIQAEGREVPDLTVTELNLFHIKELRMGQFNHKPYNLGWGHHHCNVVTKDAGIHETLVWMADVIDNNEKFGYKIR
jgi:hypothetical protein